VTGAERGIGRAVAAELVSQGYLVLVTDVDGPAAESTAAEIGARAGLVLDVTDPAANRLVAARATELAPLGAWVCNAGVAFDGDLTDLTEAQVRLTVDVNVLGVMWGARAAADVFREQALGCVVGGEIGIVASLSAHAPVPNLSVYAATKAAALSLATSIASELRAEGVDRDARGVRSPGQRARDPRRGRAAGPRDGRARARDHVRHGTGLPHAAGVARGRGAGGVAVARPGDAARPRHAPVRRPQAPPGRRALTPHGLSDSSRTGCEGA
jgi:NADP-dependent 3-hydroxy acid dehydrogenase YdfG